MSALTYRVASLIPNFLGSEAACGQAGQGRKEVGKGSAHQCVTRRRPTEDAEMRRATRGLSAAVCVVVAMAPLPAAAQANTPITSFSAVPTTAQAGGHPDVMVKMTFLTRGEQPATPCDCSDAKDITVHLPAGLVGNPHALPICNAVDFASAH